MLEKREQWTLEDALYDCMASAVEKQAAKFFEENKETFEKVFREFLSEEKIKECLENYDFGNWLENEIQELATPIIAKRIEEIKRALK